MDKLKNCPEVGREGYCFPMAVRMAVFGISQERPPGGSGAQTGGRLAEVAADSTQLGNAALYFEYKQIAKEAIKS
jgi:hypothetical protein